MKKVLFSLVMACTCIAGVKAQEVLLVTLQKGDVTQLFYGTDAFKEAVAAAENGNTIILGAGTFNATDITKAVSIYGSGYEMRTGETAEKEGKIAYATRINGNFTIALDSVNGQPVEGFYMEGIYTNHRTNITKHLKSASFIKCRFGELYFHDGDGQTIRSYTTTQNCLIKHCRIATGLSTGNSEAMGVYNSVIQAITYNTSTANLLIQNSLIFSMASALKCTVKSCIINYVGIAYWGPFQIAGESSIDASSSSYNCMFGNTKALDDVVTKDGNWIDANWNTTLLGKEGIKEYSDTYMYELTSEAKTTYKGDDKKEIGIYGGNSPFNTILTIPHIISKDIATKTESGKLKVSIKVKIGDNSL